MKYVLTFLGRTLAALPEFAVSALCRAVGTLIWAFPSRRVRVAFSNVSHCFPEMESGQISKTVRESACRMVEMALFVLASPYMGCERLKSNIKVGDFVREELKKRALNPRPLVLMVPHFCMMETITMFPLLVDAKDVPRTGVFYRPFDSPGLEKWVKNSRSRCGIDLISRKAGLASALNYLKNDGVIAVLFDQNAGASGVKSLFFERVCSTSELAGLFVERTGSDCAVFYAVRTGFWKSRIDGEYIKFTDRDDVTIAANNWLERRLMESETSRMDWLWLHRRWFINRNPRTCLQMGGGKNILERNLSFNGLKVLPRKDRIFILVPNDKSLADDVVGLVENLKNSRPDASATLIFPKGKVPSGLDCGADKILEIPGDGVWDCLSFFKSVGKMYPDIFLSFESGLLADAAAFLSGAPMRLSARLAGGGRRRFATLEYVDGATNQEGTFAERALRYFGMR